MLYISDENEAVIKMILKGRSPTMRHVSRTHRVALDWLFDRINLDPKISIKYVASDVAKNATRNRRRDNCGNVEADVEPGFADCAKLSYSADYEYIKSSGDTQSTKSARFESHCLFRETCRWMTPRRVLKCVKEMQKRTTV